MYYCQAGGVCLGVSEDRTYLRNPRTYGHGPPGHAGLHARGGQRGHCLFQRLFLEALLDALPVCIKGRDPRGIVKIVGQDSGVVIEPKIVVGAIDPPLLTLRELREPGGKEP